jgi:hypothetical protein
MKKAPLGEALVCKSVNVLKNSLIKIRYIFDTIFYNDASTQKKHSQMRAQQSISCLYTIPRLRHNSRRVPILNGYSYLDTKKRPKESARVYMHVGQWLNMNQGTANKNSSINRVTSHFTPSITHGLAVPCLMYPSRMSLSTYIDVWGYVCTFAR